jgi:beta-1,4-mannosyl-glycoprotein beta-1,4-N-acetylglucosaminyltransferase
MNKIFDCFMFNNEEKLLEIRLNVLNKFVDHFVIIESEETHSGNKKKITFEIDKYSKFKEKIIYKKINSFPIGLSSWQKENYQRNYIANCLNQANGDDIVMISDLDEIPNLENVNLNNYNEKIIVFNQRLFFYKMNFGANAANWHGTRACQKKFLKSPQWLRNLKTHKKYMFYRLDKLLFSKNYERSFKIINNGGWHFTWLGDLEFIKNKLRSFAHTELNNPVIINDNYIKECINNLKPIEIKQKIKINKLSINKINLPTYVVENVDKYRSLLDIN